jgi:glutaminase
MLRLYHKVCSVYLSVVELAVLGVTAAGTGDF